MRRQVREEADNGWHGGGTDTTMPEANTDDPKGWRCAALCGAVRLWGNEAYLYMAGV